MFVTTAATAAPAVFVVPALEEYIESPVVPSAVRFGVR
jgi:hypothetical protein